MKFQAYGVDGKTQMEYSMTSREQRWRSGTRTREQVKTNSGFVPRMHSSASRKAVSASCTDKGRPQPTSGGNQRGELDNVGMSLA